MPRKTKTATADKTALPRIPAELLEQLIPGPVTPGQLEDIFQQFKKAFTVLANGNYSTTSGLGCQISGSIVPRASGKNVYDVTVNFGAAPCSLPNTSASGNAVITNLDAGGRQLAVIATTADGVYAAAFFGQR